MFRLLRVFRPFRSNNTVLLYVRFALGSDPLTKGQNDRSHVYIGPPVSGSSFTPVGAVAFFMSTVTARPLCARILRNNGSHGLQHFIVRTSRVVSRRANSHVDILLREGHGMTFSRLLLTQTAIRPNSL
jgi:hypothetical protein